MIDPDAMESYVRKHGVSCPRCGSHNIDPQDAEVDGGDVTHTARCNTCQYIWADRYTLVEAYEEDDCPQVTLLPFHFTDIVEGRLSQSGTIKVTNTGILISFDGIPDPVVSIVLEEGKLYVATAIRRANGRPD